jgi:ABC-type lipoprotein export system ATPase subunit
MTLIIEGKNLSKRYELGKNNHVHALRGIEIRIEQGEMVAVMGASGSGKSTVMHILGCLDKPDKGEVYIGGRRADTLVNGHLARLRSREIGFIFQGFNLVPTMSAAENVALAAEYAGHSRREAAKMAEDALRIVGLGDRLRHSPSELSGGQQQRVAIARAMVNKPGVILGDEPTGDLDSATSREIIDIMRDINLKTGTTFVLVTHNPEVGQACDRIITMQDGLVISDERADVKEDSELIA